MPRQIVIVGGPHTGKTTLAERLKRELNIAQVMHSTDDLIGLGWSEASEAASKWFSNNGDWIVEGVSTARALRKWLAANPEQALEAEIIVLDEAFTPLLKGQQSMTTGVHTVFQEIEPELVKRGARIQKLKTANDAIRLFEINQPPQSGKQKARGSMLKTSYDNQDSIPENMRGAYVQSGGKWVLDELTSDHPVLVHNKKLLSEKSTATTKAEELQADLDAAKGSSIPRGHVAVAKADAELLEKVKAHGSGDEVLSKLTEHKNLKEKEEQRTRTDNLREVAKLLSYEPEAFVRLQGLPEFEIRDKDGQKTVIAKVKDGSTIVEKPAQEYVESSSEIAPFLPALKAQNGTRVHGSSSNSGTPAKDVFTRIRERTQNEQKQGEKDIHPMFRQIPGRTTAQTGE